MPYRLRALLVLALALASGAAALVYEVVFFRGFGLAFGVASHAVASVVGAFLFGLGLGAWLGGRWLARSRPLVAYACVELAIALYGWCAPDLMRLARGAVERGELGLDSPLVALLAAFVLLAWPTVCMGATFPLLGRAVARDGRSAWTSIGWLYAINTLGACLGALLAAYELLPRYGLAGTTHFAVASNVAIALVALWLARGESRHEQPSSELAVDGPSIAAPAPLLAFAVASVGAAALALQVLAHRVILSLLGGTVYVFAAIVAVFLFGVALGGALGGHLGQRTRRPATLLGVLALAFALSVGIGIALLRSRAGGEDLLLGPDNIALLEPGEWVSEYPPSRYLSLTVSLSALALLGPTLISGAFFPIALAWARGLGSQLGASLGRTYLWNTLGSIAGSLLASFVLLPMLGLRGGFVALCALPILCGIALLWSGTAKREGSHGALRWAALAASACGLVALLPGTPPGTREELRTVFVADAAASSAKVQEFSDSTDSEPIRNLRVNGKTVASSIFIDRRLQYLLGCISTLAHPKPDKLVCIGLGTGMTSAAMAACGGELTVVELSPAVIEAARRFEAWNTALHARADVRIVADDGRAWLARTDERFDVISADPIDPCVSGSAYLYTEEYYALGRARLAEGGLMSQWIPLYDLAPSDIAGIVRTFRRVFPHATAWVTGYDMLLLGGAQPLRLDLAHVAERMEERAVRELLEAVGIESAEELLGCCFAGPEALAWIEERSDRPNTDDDPWIEFHAPLAAYGSYPLEVYRWLASAADEPPLAGSDRFQREAVLAERARLQRGALDFVADIDSGAGYGAARTRYIEFLRRR
jgi:predicted membrane-bound spermidine synthase